MSEEEKPISEENLFKNTQRRNRYFDLLDEIGETYSEFSHIVYNSGTPYFIDDASYCPTAQIEYDPIIDSIRYVWNSNFFDRMNDSEVKFISMHESFHILLNHAQFMNVVEDKKLFNIAADIVVNDIITMNFKEIKVPEGAYSGKKILGYNCNQMSADKVYDILFQKALSGGESFNFSNSDGSSGEIVVKVGEDGKIESVEVNGAKVYDQHDSMSDIPEEIWEKLEKEMEELNDSLKSRGLGPGNRKHLIQKKENKFSLRNLIKKVVGKRVEEEFNENWRRYNIKLSYVYPEIILPYITISEAQSKLSLLFAIDTSSSISPRLINEFVAIARNHSTDFDVKALFFDTRCHPFDIKSHYAYGRGGTSFANLTKFIFNDYKEDFDVVFVLTDGYGGSPSTSKIDPKKWFWILTPRGAKIEEKYGKSFEIPQEYLRGI